MSVKKTLSSFLFLALWVAMIVQAIPHIHHVYSENAHIESQQGIYKHFVSFYNPHESRDADKNHEHNDHEHFLHTHNYPAYLDNCSDELTAKQLLFLNIFFCEVLNSPEESDVSKSSYVEILLVNNPFLHKHSLRGPPSLA